MPRTIDITPVTPAARRRRLVTGLVFVALGSVLLARSFGLPVPERWWALLLLIPALPSLARAWAEVTRGELALALRSLVPAFVLWALTLVFLLNLDWSYAWPALLIYAGISMLIPRRENA